MKKINQHHSIYWTLDKLMEDGKKYQTKGYFKKNSSSAYAIARRKGLLVIC